MSVRLLLVAMFTLAWTGNAFAQKAEADVAFQRGRALMTEGKYAEACPAFETSMRLDPLNGTLYNLALCHEKLGKIASAWTELKQIAATDSNKKRAGDAAQRVAALEPRLTRMRLVLAEPGPGVVVLRDNIDVTALVGETPPVDPGRYTFEARTVGKPPVSLVVEIAGEGTTVEVVLPAAAAAPIAPPPAAISTSYPTQLPLRPIAIPDGMVEVSASSVLQDSTTFMANPIDGFVAARVGLRSFQLEAALGSHLRYSVPMYRDHALSLVSVGARYAITPMLVAGLQYVSLKPFEDLSGSDLRGLLARKILLTPRIAVDGRAGFQFSQRAIAGNYGSTLTPNELALVTEGRAQAWATSRLSFELLTNLDLNVGGELYAYTTTLAVTGSAHYAIEDWLDVVLQGSTILLPAGDFLSVGIGARWRSR